MEPIDLDFVQARFAATQPRPRTTLGFYFFLASLVIGAMVVSTSGPRWGLPEALCLTLPWLVVSGIMLSGSILGRRQRALRREITRACEAVQLDAWDEARTVVDRLTRQSIRSRYDRGQLFLLLATLSERAHQYEAAAWIYETLVLQQVGDTYQLQHATIALAAAKLRTGELTDAITMIGRLEKVPMPQPLRAACDLVRLFQQVSMGQCDDALANLGERRALFRRHLSTRGGLRLRPARSGDARPRSGQRGGGLVAETQPRWSSPSG